MSACRNSAAIGLCHVSRHQARVIGGHPRAAPLRVQRGPARDPITPLAQEGWLRNRPAHLNPYETLNPYTEQTVRSEEHTSELQSRLHLVCRLLLGKKKN